MRASRRSRQSFPPGEKLACLRCRGVYRAPAERCPIDGARLHRGTRDPLLGTWFVGRFLIEEMVGDGPLGRIYRARDLRDRRELAVRVLAGELRHDAERAIGREAGKAHEPFDAFQPVANHKARHECVLLPFEALKDALNPSS